MTSKFFTSDFRPRGASTPAAIAYSSNFRQDAHFHALWTGPPVPLSIHRSVKRFVLLNLDRAASCRFLMSPVSPKIVAGDYLAGFCSIPIHARWINFFFTILFPPVFLCFFFKFIYLFLFFGYTSYTLSRIHFLKLMARFRFIRFTRNARDEVISRALKLSRESISFESCRVLCVSRRIWEIAGTWIERYLGICFYAKLWELLREIVYAQFCIVFDEINFTLTYPAVIISLSLSNLNLSIHPAVDTWIVKFVEFLSTSLSQFVSTNSNFVVPYF